MLWKSWYIQKKIPDIFKILLYCEPKAYPGYREFLEYSLHKPHNSRNPAIRELEVY